MKGDHVSKIDGSVDPENLNAYLLPFVDTQVRERLVESAQDGEFIHLHQPRVRQRAKVQPSASSRIREVWEQIWKDAAKGRSIVFPPETQTHWVAVPPQLRPGFPDEQGH